MAKKDSLVEKNESGEALSLPAKPEAKDGLKAIAEWYFLVHSDNLKQIGVKNIIVCEDGEVFYDNVKGANAAINYCRSKQIGSEQFTNPF